MPPVSKSSIFRIDFVTPYLSLGDIFPPTELDSSHDPDGIPQKLMGRLENRFYTKDNKVKYLRMQMENNVHSYVFKSR